MQKLLARHRAEVAAAHGAAAEQQRQALDAAAAQHELGLRALKEKLLRVSNKLTVLLLFSSRMC